MPFILVLLAGLLALAARPGTRARRILRITRVVRDLDVAEAFYVGALGFRPVSRQPVDPALPGLLGLPQAQGEELVLALGGQEIALVRFDPPGPAYPRDSRSDDLWFQHLAIVVSHMGAAFRRLSAHGPKPISTDGPQRLPRRNGRVVAFKFRDPDGHPLELIHFPPRQGRALWHDTPDGDAASPFLGIDHSAIAISRTRASVRFYKRLGFAVAYRSLNHGRAQNRLDGLAQAVARITGLGLGDDPPGLELLRYRPPGRTAPAMPVNARVTDWVTLLAPGLKAGRRLADGRRAAAIRDPDGHLLLLVDRA